MCVLFCSLMQYREASGSVKQQSDEGEVTEVVAKSKYQVSSRKYSPFPVSIDQPNKADYAVARVDDIINWSQKVELNGVYSKIYL